MTGDLPPYYQERIRGRERLTVLERGRVQQKHVQFQDEGLSDTEQIVATIERHVYVRACSAVVECGCARARTGHLTHARNAKRLRDYETR